MSLFVVTKKNPYKKVGTYLKHYPGEGMQEVEVGSEEGRLVIVNHVGLMLDEKTLGPFVIQVMSKGLDAGAARQDMRRQRGF